MGRGWLEQIVQQQGQRERAVARREGSCGHRQWLVGSRPRQVVTLLGVITIPAGVLSMLASEGARERASGHAVQPRRSPV